MACADKLVALLALILMRLRRMMAAPAHCATAAPSALAPRRMVPDLYSIGHVGVIPLPRVSLRLYRDGALLVGCPWVEFRVLRCFQESSRFVRAPAHSVCAQSPFRELAKWSMMMCPLGVIVKMDGHKRTSFPTQHILPESGNLASSRTLGPTLKIYSVLV